MRSVMCRRNNAEFADQMARMRRWLDHRRCRVHNFDYHTIVCDIIVIQIDFAKAADTSEFADEFAGEPALAG
jgi:hypothetical protein